MKVLITGGAGFIGSNFIYYMLSHYPSYELICLDLLTYAGNINNLQKALSDPNFRFIYGDIANRELVYELFARENFDWVVNFAAESHVDRSITDPAAFLMTNTIGTHVLLDACRLYGIGRFHQISTDEVYGDLPIERLDLSFTESSALQPSSPYSASKAAADLMVFAYGRTYKLPVSVSRCSNNYGPYQHYEKLIPLTIVNALKDKSIPVYGDGENVRDWIYVQDHCRAIDLILHKGSPGGVFNIGGGQEISNLEVVRSILRHIKKPQSFITFVPDRPGHDRRYSIDSSKLTNTLGWRPKTSFDIGIIKTIDWYIKNHGGEHV